MLIVPVFIASAGSARAQVSRDEIQRIEQAIDTGDTRQLKKALDALPKGVRTEIVKALWINIQVIGGGPELIENFPWQVALVDGSQPESRRTQFCGGTIIAPDLIITAAHCVETMDKPSLVDVVAGAAAYEYGGQRVKVRQILIHDKWKLLKTPADRMNRTLRDFDFDVALLRLETRLQLGRPITLAQTTPEPKSSTWLSGWGATSEGGSGTRYLNAAVVTIVEHNECNAPGSYDHQLTPHMLCAGKRDGSKDACKGDSGGPLVTGPLLQERLVGIVSNGIGCGQPGKFGIYTDVASIAAWVTEQSGVRPAPLVAGELFTLSSPSPSPYPDR
jgi:transmembrane serine protease 11D